MTFCRRLSLACAIAAGAVCAQAALLEPVPEPDWQRLDPVIEEQLRAARQRLDEALQKQADDDASLAAAMGRAAKYYHTYGLWEAAAAAYRNASQLAPNDFRWPYLLARLYGDGKLRSGHVREAIRHYRDSLRLNAMHVPTWVGLGDAQINVGSSHEARTSFERALALEPDNAAAHLGLGSLDVVEENHARALKHLSRALREQPAAGRIHYMLALAYRGLGEVERAKSHLTKITGHAIRLHDPLMAQVQSLRTGAPVEITRGLALRRAEQFEQAAAAFQRATELDPSSASAYTNLGSTLLILERWNDAMKALSAATALNPADPIAHYNLGIVHAVLDEDVNAINQFTRAVSLHPAYARAHHQLADALAREGRYADALRHYERTVELAPGNEVALNARILMLARSERFEEAIRLSDAALHQFPRSLELTVTASRLLAACPQTQLRSAARALQLARRLGQAGHDLRQTETLAMALAAVGNFTEAISLQRRAIALAKTAGNAQLELALKDNLERYEANRSARAPWTLDDPVFAPDVL